MSEEKQIKLVMVSEKVEKTEHQQIDPLQQQITTMKLTANLLKQMSFNSTVNKFDYFEKLIHKQNDKFNAKIQKCTNNQKQLTKKIRMVQKNCKQIKNQSAILNYAKVHVQFQQLRTIKQETLKYQKLSQGMVKYLQKIDERLNKM